jgi:pimeloyl-ACP methyl ester carboxylesterase
VNPAPLPTVVLVHGAWAGSWVWGPVVPRLAELGYDVMALDLPGAGDPEECSALAEQVAVVCRAVDGSAGPLVLVGHSGGGIVATAAAEELADRVAAVVYVAGMMLPSGTHFDDFRAEIGSEPDQLGVAPYLELALGGRGTVVPPEVAVAVLFQLAPPAAAIAAAGQLRPQWTTGLDIVATWTAERFGRIPRLYVETGQDRDLPPALQQHMQRRTPGAEVVRLDADHAPQLSATAELVAALHDFVARTLPRG